MSLLHWKKTRYKDWLTLTLIFLMAIILNLATVYIDRILNADLLTKARLYRLIFIIRIPLVLLMLKIIIVAYSRLRSLKK